RVNSYCEVSDSILYNHVNVGRHSKIRRAIIDRHVNLPEHTEIGYNLEADKRRYHVTESGIVVVVRQGALIEEPELVLRQASSRPPYLRTGRKVRLQLNAAVLIKGWKIAAKAGGINVNGNQGLDFAEYDDGVVSAPALV